MISTGKRGVACLHLCDLLVHTLQYAVSHRILIKVDQGQAPRAHLISTARAASGVGGDGGALGFMCCCVG